MFYSKTTGGFYSREIHGINIPADAVEITAEQHSELIEGQSQGKRIVADENGRPVLADPPEPTPEEIQAAKNAEARAYLSSTDWYVVRFAETGTEIPEDILAARQAARDSIVE
jgi:hypothetical protein